MLKSNPRISVLMAVYNTDFDLVKRAIDSVLKQDFLDFELIVIDDGSENDPDNFLLNYIKKYEQRIVYMRHTNCGQSQSINRGVLNSKGEFITILDADDEYKPNHLRECLEKMKQFDLIASITETVVDDDADYYVPDKNDLSKLIHVDNCVLFATLFGKKEIFNSLKFDNVYAADAQFFERAAQKYHVKKVDLRTYIYYRNIPNSICATTKRKQIADYD